MQQIDTDLMLINSVLAGQTNAYGILVERHQRFVFTLALRFTKNREEAEEVAQDSFVKAYRSLGTFKHNAKFSTWLYSIVYTTAMTFLRKKRLDTTTLNDQERFLEIPNQGSGFDADLVTKKSTYSYLNQAIEMLSATDSSLITMFYKSELSLEEIGVIVGSDANTVKVKLFRARTRLKEKMELILGEESQQLI